MSPNPNLRACRNNPGLSELYAGTFNLPADPAEAVQWCRRAAEAGHPHAQFNLGITLLKDASDSRNREAAVRWFEKAAHQDHVDCVASALTSKIHRVEVGDMPSSVRDPWAGMVHS